jgi:hypothetical protein
MNTFFKPTFYSIVPTELCIDKAPCPPGACVPGYFLLSLAGLQLDFFSFSRGLRPGLLSFVPGGTYVAFQLILSLKKYVRKNKSSEIILQISNTF